MFIVEIDTTVIQKEEDYQIVGYTTHLPRREAGEKNKNNGVHMK